jgi:hypothetical protein
LSRLLPLLALLAACSPVDHVRTPDGRQGTAVRVWLTVAHVASGCAEVRINDEFTAYPLLRVGDCVLLAPVLPDGINTQHGLVVPERINGYGQNELGVTGAGGGARSRGVTYPADPWKIRRGDSGSPCYKNGRLVGLFEGLTVP